MSSMRQPPSGRQHHEHPPKSRRRRAAEANTHGLPTGEPLRRALARVFREQRLALLAWLRTGRKARTVAGAKADGASPEDLPAAWPDWNDFGLGALRMSERMTPLLEAVWDQAAGRFAAKVGLDPDEWTVINPHTERMIQDAAFAFCAATNATTSQALDQALDQLRDELTAGVVTRGETLDQLTRRVETVFDAAETWRARAIAQTETARAVHAAQEQAAIASGVVTGWEWLLSDDACPMCQTVARRAKHVRLGQPFATHARAPEAYQQVKFPPLHPHCNCTCLPVLDTDEQPRWAETLRDPTPDTVDNPGGKPGHRTLRPAAHPDGVPRFPAAKRITIEPSSRSGRKALADATMEVLGLRRTPVQLAAMVGAPDGARLSFAASADRGTGRGAIDFRVEHASLARYHGSIEKLEGQAVLYIGRLDVAPHLWGKGMATGIHGRMVDWASRLGVDRLQLFASAADGDNGYVTWPLLGYDGLIPSTIRKRLPQHLAGAATLGDLLAAPGGWEVWQGLRQGLHVSFDLAPGSPSRIRWADYWRGKTPTRREEVMDRQRGKSFITDLAVPNSLGLSAEEIAEGIEILARCVARRHAEHPHEVRTFPRPTGECLLLMEAQDRGEDVEALRDRLSAELNRRIDEFARRHSQP